MALSKIRSRLAPALRWLAPSAAAASAGAIAAGAVEGWGAGQLGAVATAGFAAVLVAPALLAISVIARGLIAAWRPAPVGDEGSPRLAGWLAVIALGAAALAAVMFQSVWALALNSGFKPTTVSFVEPLVAVTTALGVVALSRPVAHAIAWLAARLDARWRRRGRRTLLSPARLVGTLAVVVIAAGYAAWRWVIRPRLVAFDTGVFCAPAAALVVLAVIPARWRRLPARATLAVTGGAAIAAIATAVIVSHVRPALALEIWGDRAIAGVAIERVFDLDEIRDRMSLAQFRPAAQPGAAHPDIVLITIDTVRADHTPPYGGQAEMPGLADLAARGVVFERAFSPSNVTRRSIPSIAIGLAPDRVRGRVVGWALRVDPRHVLLAERLRAGGYDTAGFMCCEGFWGKGFHTGLERGLVHLEIEADGTALARRARAWIDARERRADRAPLFLWMHVLEPHNWTKLAGEPRSDDERRRYYDRALAAADQIARDVIAGFAGRAPARMPIFIVTADHGEALGEHGQPYHSTDLYNSQIHVPLVIQGPGLPAHRVGETASLTDLVPTVLDLAGFVVPYGRELDGRSLAELARGARVSGEDAGVAFAAMIKDRSNPGGLTAAIKGRWKLIDNNNHYELYDLGSDPAERSDVLAQHPEIAAELRRMLDQRKVAATISPFE